MLGDMHSCDKIILFGGMNCCFVYSRAITLIPYNPAYKPPSNIIFFKFCSAEGVYLGFYAIYGRSVVHDVKWVHR